ncbi:MAG: MFS transporter [Pseudomonadales bacterium]|nr:MFS transporter [Pseudomonadales bacterium]
MPQTNDSEAQSEPKATMSTATKTNNSVANLFRQGQFQLYVAGQTGWYAAWGVRHVLFPWLIVLVLHESPERVGFAQMAILLPSLFLILIGGATADRIDLRKLLIMVQLAALVPPLGLAILIYLGHLNYQLMVIYGLLMGICMAFITPARDALLSKIADQQIQQAVTISIGLQFGCQIIGIGIAGAAVSIGAPALLSLQAGFIGLALMATWALLPAPSVRDPLNTNSAWRDIQDGLKIAVKTPLIMPIIALMVAMGFCFMGWFLVILPLTIRDVFAGDSPQLAFAHTCFMSGTVAATVMILRLGKVTRPGKALTLSLAATAVLILISQIEMSLSFYLTGVFLIGMSSGINMSMARAMVQEAAPASFRARLLSIFQLGYLGAAPIGALAMGYLTAYMGPLQAAIIPGSLLAITIIIIVPRTGLWHVKDTIVDTASKATLSEEN